MPPFASLTGNVKGIVTMVAATAIFSCGDAAMKIASASLPPSENVFLRSLLTTSVLFVAALYSGALRFVRRLLVPAMGMRCIGEVGGAMFFQTALARMPLADIAAINQLGPLSLTAASAAFLGEKVGWRRWSAVAVGLIGALLIIKPGTSAFNVWALVAILSVLSGTLRDVSTRKIDVTTSPLAILLISQAALVIASSTFALFSPWHMPSATHMLYVAFAGVCSMVGHLLMITSIRSAELSAVAPFRYASIIWAITLGWLVWRQLPDMISLAGICIVISAGLYTFYREQHLKRQRRRTQQGPRS